MSTTTSPGMSLANALYEALDEFRRAFGHAPRLILIPLFRVPEIEAMGPWFGLNGAGYYENKFAGIPFRFTDGSVIELS